jgi:hypothetical protein
LTAATTKDYLAELAGPGDELSSLPAFTKAVPESRRAALAFFMNLESIGSQYVAPGSPYEAFGTSLKAIGGQYFDEGSGNGSWSVRIVRDCGSGPPAPLRRGRLQGEPGEPALVRCDGRIGFRRTLVQSCVQLGAHLVGRVGAPLTFGASDDGSGRCHPHQTCEADPLPPLHGHRIPAWWARGSISMKRST